MINFISLLFLTTFPLVISDDMRFNACTNASSYVDGSTFSSNLNRAMGDLLKNSPQTGFSTSSHGQSPNGIYGLFQCMGKSVSQKDCSISAQRANISIRQLCGNYIGGQEWSDKWFLRYQNYSFFKKLDTNGDFLENAKVIVTNNISNFKKATNVFDSGITIYGLVQCLRDLIIKDCRSCLEAARNKISQCCSMKQGAQAVFGSCTVRYEIYPFFNASGENSTSTPGANPPTVAPESPPANGTSKDSSAKTLPIVLGIIGGAVIVLIVCVFAMRNKLKSAISERLFNRMQNKGIHECNPGTTILQQEQIVFNLKALIEATDNFHEKTSLEREALAQYTRESSGQEQAIRCIHVAPLCAHADAGIRPTIANGILMISSSSVTLPNPTHPAFVKSSEYNLEESTAGCSNSGIHESSSMSAPTAPLGPSLNDVTITELEPR